LGGHRHRLHGAPRERGRARPGVPGRSAPREPGWADACAEARRPRGCVQGAARRSASEHRRSRPGGDSHRLNPCEGLCGSTADVNRPTGALVRVRTTRGLALGRTALQGGTMHAGYWYSDRFLPPIAGGSGEDEPSPDSPPAPPDDPGSEMLRRELEEYQRLAEERGQALAARDAEL